jgi:hypothetical protein
MPRFASLILLSCLAVPAHAQIAGRHDSGPMPRPNLFIDDGRMPSPGPGRDLRDARRQIDHARERGSISRREAKALRREARLIGQLTERYGRDGLSAAEQQELGTRTGALRGTATRPGSVATARRRPGRQ